MKFTLRSQQENVRLRAAPRFAADTSEDGPRALDTRDCNIFGAPPVGHPISTFSMLPGCLRQGLSAAAAVLTMCTSVSLLKPAMPTAPTTWPAARIGMPPRSAAMLAVTNAVRPLLMLSSIPPSVVVAARPFVSSRSRGSRLPPEHPLRSNQISGRINHRDCRDRMALSCTCLRCLQAIWAAARSRVVTLIVRAPTDRRPLSILQRHSKFGHSEPT
jgi:hypothetical protein